MTTHPNQSECGEKFRECVCVKATGHTGNHFDQERNTWWCDNAPHSPKTEPAVQSESWEKEFERKFGSVTGDMLNPWGFDGKRETLEKKYTELKSFIRSLLREQEVRVLEKVLLNLDPFCAACSSEESPVYKHLQALKEQKQ